MIEEELTEGEKLMFDFMDKIRKIEPVDMVKTTRVMTISLIWVMRGIEGDQFVEEFLTAAIQNKEKMVLGEDNPYQIN